MIITHVRAENFLKYASLDLTDLPASGLIAVSGPNESGKSTIGETICFALFGRTYSVKADTPEKLIRWGQSRCNVGVEFKARNDRHYRVSRYLDAEGTQGARLESLDDGEVTLAKGTQHVAEALPGLIGFGYEEFVESFYLAQRELTTPHPHSHALMAMAGIAPLARIRDELQDANTQDAAADADTGKHIAELDNQIAELGIDQQRLPDLEATRATLASAEEEKFDRLTALQNSAADYQENLPNVRKSRASRRRARLSAVLLFVLAAVLWGGWAVLTQFPDAGISQQLSAWLTNTFPAWQSGREVTLLAAAVVATVLFIVVLAVDVRQGGQLDRLSEHALNLAQQLDLAVDSAKAGIREPLDQAARLVSVPEPASDPANTDSPGSTEATRSESAESTLINNMATLRNRVTGFDADTTEVKQAVDNIETELSNQSTALKDHATLLDRAIEEEQQRLREAERLEGMLEGYRDTRREREHRIRVRETGISLLESASRERSHEFNRGIRSLAGRALPRFTHDRYQHLQIDETLSVRVFSNNKHDFMDFDEISSGTQRQIMLAVRLALSQELIRSTVGGAQFIFLDEPFAFFDEQRMLETLHAMPELSDELAQIWIIAQQLPESAQVDAHIRCSQDIEALTTTPPRPEVVAATPDMEG